jgi:hypothetical protein
LHACGIDDSAGGGGNFRADAFAGNQGDFVPHGCIVLYAKVLTLSKVCNARVARKAPLLVQVK